MKVNLVPIGNSRGVRIPASVIKECGFSDQLDMRVTNGVVILAPARSAREGWETAFERMAAAGQDEPLIDDALDNDFDNEDWTW